MIVFSVSKTFCGFSLKANPKLRPLNSLPMGMIPVVMCLSGFTLKATQKLEPRPLET